ncbi:MAG: SH3 domain-containing protein, partial [Ruegeria sp.]
QQPVQVASTSEPAPKPITPAPAEDLVKKAAIQQTQPVQPKAEPKPAVAQADTQALLTQVAAGLNADLSLFDGQAATFSLASLDQGATALQQIAPPTSDETPQTSAPAEPVKDIREVSGTRVNMRDGPGTIYPIVGKVTIGQKVEVMSDSGTGWLRLRVLPGQQIGWISASLIRKTEN